MKPRLGQVLASTVDSTTVIVVRAPDGEIDLTCAGVAMWDPRCGGACPAGEADPARFGLSFMNEGGDWWIAQAATGELSPDQLAVALMAHCRSRLAAYKCPRSIEFSVSLPRTPTGKLLRRVLRDQHQRA